ncbi:MarR family winged helix-turn-helix transcriptional regulator [Paenibacillus sp. NPDC056579]|uniref:MarR family winged helix-turn-helix transcriptional regulator n=1 Tax=unclassified Paenibacillus TaxID=185978 RepID=UPI001EF7E0A6|nr:MarR family transcriptional regulator [Paenibacillus sp. H1-7]ULL17972.1 MarR family transcriptional regulator [Paenibacillus sp. H1-7]
MVQEQDDAAKLAQVQETARLVMRKLISYCKYVDHRFSGSQVSALEMVEAQGAVKVSQLAEYLSLSASAVTLLSDKLIEFGYLQRERTKGDRRVVCLVITDEGRAMLEQLLAKETAIVSRWLQGISIEELSQFNQVLHRIRSNVKAASSGKDTSENR